MTTTFRRCPTSVHIELNMALKEAERLSYLAKQSLLCTLWSNRRKFFRYKEWFGDYNEERYATVTHNVKKIWDHITNKDIIFNCVPGLSSGDDAAYVFPDKPYEIFLNPRFWELRMKGVQSKSGTIVHEMSHFYDVLATVDIAYSQSQCRKLATDKPSEAIRNANNYMYFVESGGTYFNDATTPSIVDFASNRCISKPFSIRSHLMPKLRIPKKRDISLRFDIMSEPNLAID